jgi:2-dehydropantoate 2-reductase
MATYLVPGVVQSFPGPQSGIMDVGRYPGGNDNVANDLADELRHAGFDSCARGDIMRWKRTKLLANLGNALQAACVSFRDLRDLHDRAQAEAVSCYEAAGLEFVLPADATQRQGGAVSQLIDGKPFPGGSSWQSLARGSHQIETDYLNGEVVLLGRLHAVPTPVNDMLQRLARQLADGGVPPGSLSSDDVRALLVDATASRPERFTPP